MEPVLGWTTHHSIVEYNGKWYLFYHDCELSGGINHRRCVKFTRLTIRDDGTIETIRPYQGQDPAPMYIGTGRSVDELR
jgi:hypothetical protein